MLLPELTTFRCFASVLTRIKVFHRQAAIAKVMSYPQLTAGIVPSLVEGSVDCYKHPGTLQVLRVIKVKKRDSCYGPDRYRVILSDGHNFVQALLVTQLNHLVTSGELVDGGLGIIRLRDYMSNLIQDVPVIIIIQMDVVRNEYGCKIGNPADVLENKS